MTSLVPTAPSIISYIPATCQFHFAHGKLIKFEAVVFKIENFLFAILIDSKVTMQSFHYCSLVLNTPCIVSLCQQDILAILSLPILHISKTESLV